MEQVTQIYENIKSNENIDFKVKLSLDILNLSSVMSKSTNYDQALQANYYEAIRWSIVYLSQKYLEVKDYENYFLLIKNTTSIKNTNMTFLIKIISKLITQVENIKELGRPLIILIKEIIDICEKSNNISMKNKLNIKLAELYYINEEYKQGLDVITTTLVDLKRYEDNLGLIEIQVIESKIHYKSKGIVKAKSALTTVKTLITKVYIEPFLQAKIDMHSGILAAYEKDFGLSYSYFYESFDVYNLPQINRPDEAMKAMQYMIMSKIMAGKLDDLNNIIYGKNQQKYFGREVEAFKEIEKAVRGKNIRMLSETVMQYKDILLTDFFLKHHLNNLHGDLLEKNLKKIIEPYSVVEIDFITNSVGIQSDEILNKLSQMILDKKINGILDQGRGSLIIYEDSSSNEYLEKSLKCYKNLDKVIDSLMNKAKASNIN
jgi:26S proteasome regulatory subunit N6